MGSKIVFTKSFAAQKAVMSKEVTVTSLTANFAEKSVYVILEGHPAVEFSLDMIGDFEEVVLGAVLEHLDRAGSVVED